MNIYAVHTSPSGNKFTNNIPFSNDRTFASHVSPVNKLSYVNERVLSAFAQNACSLLKSTRAKEFLLMNHPKK